MKRKVLLGLIVLVAVMIVSGCSVTNLTKFIPFRNHNENPEDVAANKKPVVTKTPQEIALDINRAVDKMVVEIDAGNWQGAITVGEAAYSSMEKYKLAKVSMPINSGENSELDSARVKLYETLTESYDYKNIIKGLSVEEIIRYVRTARAKFEINPNEPFKRLAMSKVLLDTNNIKEGLKLAIEADKAPEHNKDTLENLAWAQYLSGNKVDSYKVYRSFYPQSETLTQLYHSARVIEEQDRLLGLILYKGCIRAGNNLMVLKPNVQNLSAESYINTIINRSEQAINRMLVGGFRVDSQYNVESINDIINSIVKLAKYSDK